jgi:hypothetical protein
MLGLIIQNVDSTIYALLRELIEGQNKNGGYVAKTQLINGDKTTTWRELRPLDFIIGGLAGNYSTLIVAGAVYTQVCVGTSPPVARLVPPGVSILHLGWYIDGNLGPAGNMQVVLNNILRNEISAPEVFQAVNHLELTLTQLVWAQPNDLLTFQVLNPTAGNVTCMCFPFAFLIGPAAQLGIEPPIAA